MIALRFTATHRSRPRRIGHALPGVKAALLTALLLAPSAAGEEQDWVARAYESALTRYAQGQHETAFTALEDLENRQVAAGAGDSLRAAERRIMAGLARREPAAVPALLLLHHDAYLRYRAASRHQLAAHALQLLLETAESAEVRGAPMAVRRVAGLALTSLAELAIDLSPTDALELLRRSTDLDPRSAPALLLAGAIHEKHGRYAEAIGALRRRVEIEPSPEARLRLAINLRRTGDVTAATQMLGELEQAAPDWVAVLASQELAGILADQGRWREAARRVEAALGRHPSDGTLPIQWVYFLERAGEPAAALRRAEQAARAASSAPAPGEGTPRVRYNRWPKQAFAEAAARLRQDAEPQLPRLAAALAAPSGTGG